MNVQGSGSSESIALRLLAGGTGSASTLGQARATGSGAASAPQLIGSIQNDQGQSLLDIRAELESDLREALDGFDGSEDLGSVIELAITSSLRAHGFDPSEVQAAMQDSALSTPGLARGGNPFASGSGYENASLFPSGGNEQDLVQAFLENLRSGSNLDLSI